MANLNWTWRTAAVEHDASACTAQTACVVRSVNKPSQAQKVLGCKFRNLSKKKTFTGFHRVQQARSGLSEGLRTWERLIDFCKRTLQKISGREFCWRETFVYTPLVLNSTQTPLSKREIAVCPGVEHWQHLLTNIALRPRMHRVERFSLETFQALWKLRASKWIRNWNAFWTEMPLKPKPSLKFRLWTVQTEFSLTIECNESRWN